uniref:Uncharacterized protein n=1 Tax=candidate division WOR-3 bacterium TaxID=2052148 RepID=A0A7C6AA56_UNCW3
MAKRLGEMAFANPTLYLTLYEDLGIINLKTMAKRGKISPYRSDSVRILCPDCRRRTYLNEVWGY